MANGKNATRFDFSETVLLGASAPLFFLNDAEIPATPRIAGRLRLAEIGVGSYLSGAEIRFYSLPTQPRRRTTPLHELTMVVRREKSWFQRCFTCF